MTEVQAKLGIEVITKVKKVDWILFRIAGVDVLDRDLVEIEPKRRHGEHEETSYTSMSTQRGQGRELKRFRS